MANRLLTKAEVMERLEPAAEILDGIIADYRKEHAGEDIWLEFGWSGMRLRHGDIKRSEV